MMRKPNHRTRRLRLWMAVAVAACFTEAAAAAQGAVRPAPKSESAAEKKLSKAPSVQGLPNLTLVKEKLTSYHDCTCDCGCYADELASVGARALTWLKQYLSVHRIKDGKTQAGKKVALVLDIDETAVENWKFIREHDFTYSQELFLKWYEEAKAPAIKPVLALFQFARQTRLAVFFITGRPESERAVTVKDLEAAGYTGWSGLIMRQPDSPPTAGQFKSAERTKLRNAGYLLVLNVGDQESDLAGEPAVKTFKLPNPFYFVR